MDSQTVRGRLSKRSKDMWRGKEAKKVLRFYPLVYKCTVETNFKQCIKVTVNKKNAWSFHCRSCRRRRRRSPPPPPPPPPLILFLLIFTFLIFKKLLFRFCPRRNIIPTRTIIQGGWLSSSSLSSSSSSWSFWKMDNFFMLWPIWFIFGGKLY